MRQYQELQLQAMNLPENEEAAVRAIIYFLDAQCGDDDELKRRIVATVNHYAQAEGLFESQVPADSRASYQLRDIPIGGFVFVKTKNTNNVRAACSNFARRNEGYRFEVNEEPGGCAVRRL